MAFHKPRSFFLIIAACVLFQQCFGVDKCELIRKDYYKCSTFESIITLPNDTVLEVFVQTENIELLREIQGGDSIVVLQIFNSVSMIEPNAFKNLSILRKLKLTENVMYVIRPNTFNNLDILALIISKSKVRKIKPGAFKNSRFRSIEIVDCELTVIQKKVFTNLEVISLSLAKNGIFIIEPDAMAGMVKLLYLILDHNSLQSFKSKEILHNAQKLRLLDLRHNKLTIISDDMLDGIWRLNVLLLGFNQITKIESSAFEKVPYIQRIELQNNQLKRLGSDVLPPTGLAELFVLDVNNNDLTFVTLNFILLLPKLMTFYIAGNPWQCECFSLLMKWSKRRKFVTYEHYEENTGTHPYCTVGHEGPRYCDFDISEYEESLLVKEYKKLSSKNESL